MSKIKKILVVISLNSFFVALILTTLTLYLRHRDKKITEYGVEVNFGKCLADPDPQLGHRGSRNKVCREIKKTNFDRLVYDVTYHLDSFGLRTTGRIVSTTKPAVFAVGCSYTLGLGVEDSESYPYVLQTLLPEMEIYNISSGGYSTAHLLSYFENKLEMGPHPKGQVSIMIYLGILDHVKRIVNKQHFPINSPKCIISQGEVNCLQPELFAGYQKDKEGILKKIISDLFHFDFEPSLTSKDYELYAKSVKKLKRIFEERYNGKFIFVYWPYFPTELIKKLEDENLNPISVSPALSEECLNDVKKCMIPFEQHPTAEVYNSLAHFLAKKIRDDLKL